MSTAKLYYAGQEFTLADGHEGAEAVLREAKTMIGAGGGIIEVDTNRGKLSLTVDRGIPLAVLKSKSGSGRVIA